MKYSGHKNYNAWNVSLWINNDEVLYSLAKWAIKTTDNRRQAAEKLLENLPEKTPDGVKYTVTNLKMALVDY